MLDCNDMVFWAKGLPCQASSPKDGKDAKTKSTNTAVSHDPPNYPTVGAFIIRIEFLKTRN